MLELAAITFYPRDTSHRFPLLRIVDRADRSRAASRSADLGDLAQGEGAGRSVTSRVLCSFRGRRAQLSGPASAAAWALARIYNYSPSPRAGRSLVLRFSLSNSHWLGDYLLSLTQHILSGDDDKLKLCANREDGTGRLGRTDEATASHGTG